MEVSDKLHTPVPHPQEGATYINTMGGCVGPKDSLGVWRFNFFTPAKNWTVSRKNSYYQLC